MDLWNEQRHNMVLFKSWIANQAHKWKTKKDMTRLFTTWTTAILFQDWQLKKKYLETNNNISPPKKSIPKFRIIEKDEEQSPFNPRLWYWGSDKGRQGWCTFLLIGELFRVPESSNSQKITPGRLTAFAHNHGGGCFRSFPFLFMGDFSMFKSR